MARKLLSKLTHLVLTTPKLQESLEFYRDIIGLELSGEENGSYFLRGWGEHYMHSIELKAGPVGSVETIGWRANGEEELELAVAAIEATGQGTGWVDGTLSDAYRTTILDGDPRPMNGKMPEAIAGPVLGTSGPPGVLIAKGETASADMFLVGTNTLRFYAKGSYGPDADTVISGVYDVSVGGGTFTLNHYDIGASEGTNEITLIEEDVVTVTITPN